MLLLLITCHFNLIFANQCPCEASRRLAAIGHQDNIELMPYPTSLVLQNLQNDITQFQESNCCRPLPPDLASKYSTSIDGTIQICPQNHACLPLQNISEDLLSLSHNITIASPFLSFNKEIYAIDDHNVLIKVNTNVVKSSLHISVNPLLTTELAFLYLFD